MILLEWYNKSINNSSAEVSMLKKVDRYTIGYVWPFFQSMPYDSLLDAAVHDYHGTIETDDFSHPHVVLATIGTTPGKSYYMSGDLDHAITQNVLDNLDCHSELHIPESWKPQFERIIQRRYTLKTRYDFDHSSLQPETLETFVSNLPSTYSMERIDKSIYNALIDMPWSYYMVGNFLDYNDFHAHGLGFVVKDDRGTIVSGASSFIRYNDGYEIEIATHKDYRNQGLATSIAAKFILETLKENKVPHWDAANIQSKNLALKLGYTLKKTYTVYEL